MRRQPNSPGRGRRRRGGFLLAALVFGCLAAGIIALFGPPLPGSKETAQTTPPGIGEASDDGEVSGNSNSSPLDSAKASPEAQPEASPKAQPIARPGDPVEKIGDPEPEGPVKMRPPEDSKPPKTPKGLDGDARPGWENVRTASGTGPNAESGPVALDPLNTGAKIGQLSPRERSRVEAAAENFVRVAHGAWGEGPSQREYYEQAVAATISDYGRFYASPGGVEVRRMARLIEDPGVYGTAKLERFTALQESPDTVRARVRFQVGRMIDGPVYGEQELVLVRAGSAGDEDRTGWSVASATAGAPNPVPPQRRSESEERR